jgi:NDP-hexose-3-ketoreductase
MTTLSQSIHIGILGTAQIAKRMVAPAIQGLPEAFRLIGVASRSEDSAKAFAAATQLPTYSDYEALLDNPSLQAVYIPLPNSLHAEWIEKSLKHGLHVLVEKSLACNPADVERLNNLAASKGLALVENFQFRFHRQLQVIRDVIDCGKLGKIRLIRSSFGFPPFPDTQNIRYKKELGGGALLDAGAYPLKIAQLLLGPDLELQSACLTMDSVRDVDTSGSFSLIHRSSGSVVQGAFGFDHQYQCSLEIWGSKGRLFTNRIFTAPEGFTPEIQLEIASSKESITVESDHHFQNMLMHFKALINGTADKPAEYQQNLTQANLIAQVFERATYLYE